MDSADTFFTRSAALYCNVDGAAEVATWLVGESSRLTRRGLDGGNKMKVATIVPTAYLHLVQNDNYHLCLAQAIGADGRYTDFYRTAAASGDHVILDNGAAEGYMPSIEELYEKALLINASEMVLPDKFFAMRDTLRATDNAINYLEKAGYKKPRMAVPQGRSLVEWYDCALEMSEWVDCLGIPKNLVFLDGPYGRLKAITALRLAGVEVDMHLLGCWEDPREVGMLFEHAGRIRGVDSRIPYLYASEGRSLLPGSKPAKRTIDFDDTSVSVTLLQDNISRWKEYCHGKLH